MCMPFLVLDAPRISDETECKCFVERTIIVVLPNAESEPGLFELVTLYQIHCHSRTWWKYKKVNVCFQIGV